MVLVINYSLQGIPYLFEKPLTTEYLTAQSQVYYYSKEH